MTRLEYCRSAAWRLGEASGAERAGVLCEPQEQDHPVGGPAHPGPAPGGTPTHRLGDEVRMRAFLRSVPDPELFPLGSGMFPIRIRNFSHSDPEFFPFGSGTFPIRIRNYSRTDPELFPLGSGTFSTRMQNFSYSDPELFPLGSCIFPTRIRNFSYSESGTFSTRIRNFFWVPTVKSFFPEVPVLSINTCVPGNDSIQPIWVPARTFKCWRFFSRIPGHKSVPVFTT